jgi:hypothetical protein
MKDLLLIISFVLKFHKKSHWIRKPQKYMTESAIFEGFNKAFLRHKSGLNYLYHIISIS